MDVQLSERLRAVEHAFLSAAEAGEAGLEAFSAEWASLLSVIDDNIHVLQPDTLSLAHRTSTLIEVLARNFAELHEEADEIEARAVARVEDILAQSRAPAPTTVPRSARKTLQDTCYRWFIKNLHDPYPSAAVKASLAETAHRAIANVDVWFQRARRRIGWNEVANDHFGGERHLMQKAAHVFFVEKLQDPLDPEVNLAFTQMQEHAEGMYNDRFRETEFMRTIDKLVKTMPADGVIPTRSGGKRKTKGGSKPSRASRKSAASPYPTPAPSHASASSAYSPSVSSSSRELRAEWSPSRSMSPAVSEPGTHKRRAGESEDRPAKRTRRTTSSIAARGDAVLDSIRKSATDELFAAVPQVEVAAPTESVVAELADFSSFEVPQFSVDSWILGLPEDLAWANGSLLDLSALPATPQDASLLADDLLGLDENFGAPPCAQDPDATNVPLLSMRGAPLPSPPASVPGSPAAALSRVPKVTSLAIPVSAPISHGAFLPLDASTSPLSESDAAAIELLASFQLAPAPAASFAAPPTVSDLYPPSQLAGVTSPAEPLFMPDVYAPGELTSVAGAPFDPSLMSGQYLSEQTDYAYLDPIVTAGPGSFGVDFGLDFSFGLPELAKQAAIPYVSDQGSAPMDNLGPAALGAMFASSKEAKRAEAQRIREEALRKLAEAEQLDREAEVYGA